MGSPYPQALDLGRWLHFDSGHGINACNKAMSNDLCDQCSTPLVDKARPWQRFCSDSCRNHYWNDPKNHRKPRPRSKRRHNGVEVQMDDDVLALCDKMTKVGNFRNRSDFITLAIVVGAAWAIERTIEDDITSTASGVGESQ